MKKFALITHEETAINETTLCEAHFDKHRDYALWVMADESELKSRDFVDVTENEECSCIVCGFN